MAELLLATLSPAARELLAGAAPVPGLAELAGAGFQAALARGDGPALEEGLAAMGLELGNAASDDVKARTEFWCGFEAVSATWEAALQQTPWTSGMLTAASVEWCLRQARSGASPVLGSASACRVEAIALQQIGVGQGMMSDMQRVTITWSDAAAASAESLPLSLIAKLTPPNPAVRNRLRASSLSEMEALFYAQLTPQLAAEIGIPVADVYYLEYAPVPDRFCMLMEDLSGPPRNCEPVDQILGMNRAEAEAAVDYAARLHGHFYGRIADSAFRDVRTQAEPDPAKRAYNAEAYPQMYLLWLQLQQEGRVWGEEALAQHDLSPEGPFNRCVSLYAHHVVSFYDYFNGASMKQLFTLNHGDLRADNIMAARDDSGALQAFVPIDMQTLKACPGEFDLAYLLSQSLGAQERRSWQVALIRRYHAQQPQGYSLASSLYHFQLFLVYGAARIALITAGESNMLESERGRLLFSTLMTRAMVACEEWGCLAVWENMLERVAAGETGPPPEAEALALVPEHLRSAVLAPPPPPDAVLLLSDLDGTMLGNDEGIPRFNNLWSQQPAGSVLCFNTSRPLDSFLRLKTSQASPVLTPHFLVCNGGTTIYEFPSGKVGDGQEVLNAEYAAHLGAGFDREAVKSVAAAVAKAELGQEPGPAPEPDPETGSTRPVLAKLEEFVLEQRADSSTTLRYTILLRSADTRADAARLLAALEAAFEQAGIAVHMDQSWVQLGDAHENRATGSAATDMCLTDMLPGNAGKGAATRWVRERLGFAEERTVVAGDGANDLPMFFDAGQERGIIVGNAEERLVEAHRGRPRPEHYLAEGFAADAIVEGLRHFGLAPAAPAKL